MPIFMSFLCLLLTVSSLAPAAHSKNQEFFEREFRAQNRHGCFLLVDLKTGKTIEQYNSERCGQRFPPMSTFKVPLALIGFDSGYFQSVDQEIKWDGKARGRKVSDRDQTPRTFISGSIIWVSRLIVNNLGKSRVQEYMNRFNYGNQSVTGDLNNFWLSQGSIKISAREQVEFLTRLWQGQLAADPKAIEQTKAAIFDREVNGWKLSGKTGTGCIDPNCMSQPGRQLGWYVGFAERGEQQYAFAVNFSDQKAVTGYGGPKARKIVRRYFRR